MTTTFIKAAEIWMPGVDATLLEFHSGAYGRAARVSAVSRAMCFGRGEGLPGKAWDEGRPVLLPAFERSYFRRTAAAHAAGITCAIALPQFSGESLQSVLIIFCGHDQAQPGAMELWRRDADTGDLRLADGAYGPLGTTFESVSHETRLPRGGGLPGLAWQLGESVFLEELTSDPTRFLRGKEAAAEGLQRGLAIPVLPGQEGCDVVTFLAGPSLPLAQRIERWVPDAARKRLRRVYAFSELHGGHSAIESELPVTPPAGAAPGSIAGAFTGGVPQINEYPASEPGAPAAAASSIGAVAMLAIPILRDGVVAEVLALYI